MAYKVIDTIAHSNLNDCISYIIFDYLGNFLATESLSMPENKGFIPVS